MLSATQISLILNTLIEYFLLDVCSLSEVINQCKNSVMGY